MSRRSSIIITSATPIAANCPCSCIAQQCVCGPALGLIVERVYWVSSKQLLATECPCGICSGSTEHKAYRSSPPSAMYELQLFGFLTFACAQDPLAASYFRSSNKLQQPFDHVHNRRAEIRSGHETSEAWSWELSSPLMYWQSITDEPLYTLSFAGNQFRCLLTLWDRIWLSLYNNVLNLGIYVHVLDREFILLLA